MEFAEHSSHDSGSQVLSEQEKYRKAFKVAQSLAQKVSCLGMCDFEEGLTVLNSVASLWNEDKKVLIREKEDGMFMIIM